MQRSLFPLLSLATLLAAGNSLAWGQTYLKNLTKQGWKLYMSSDAEFKNGIGNLYIKSFIVPADGAELSRTPLGPTSAAAKSIPGGAWYLLTGDHQVTDKDGNVKFNRQLVVEDALGQTYRFVATMSSDGEVHLASTTTGADAKGPVVVDKDGNLVMQAVVVGSAAGSSLVWGHTSITNLTSDSWKLYLSSVAEFKDGIGSLNVKSYLVPSGGKELPSTKLASSSAGAVIIPGGAGYLMAGDPALDKDKKAKFNQQLVVDDALGHSYRFLATRDSDGNVLFALPAGADTKGPVTADKDGNLIIQGVRARR